MQNTKAAPAVVMEWVREADRDQLAGLLLAAAGLLLSGGGGSKAGRAGRSRLLTTAQASELLGMSQRWLYQHADRLPFTRRLGRTLRFDEAGLQEWAEAHQSVALGGRSWAEARQ